MNICECVEPGRKLYTNECLKCGGGIAYKEGLADTYRFRSERLADVAAFLNNLWPGCKLLSIAIDTDICAPYCDVKMKITGTDLEEIRIALSGVVCGHLMIETLNHATVFNGERWFAIERN